MDRKITFLIKFFVIHETIRPKTTSSSPIFQNSHKLTLLILYNDSSSSPLRESIDFLTIRVQIVSVIFSGAFKKVTCIYSGVVTQKRAINWYKVILFWIKRSNVNICNLFEGSRKDTLTICTLVWNSKCNILKGWFHKFGLGYQYN